MMMSKQRCAGWRATCVAGSLMLFVAMNPASGGIISDRSAFVGDFTVLDFESRADGTPIDLREGGFILMDPDEYASLGVNITTSRNFWGTDQPWIANDSSPQFDAALDLTGSPKNMLADGTIGPTTLRFDFVPHVNALGMVLIFSTDSAPVIMSAYSSAGVLLDSVEFRGALVDGTVLGVDFGNSFDFNYGFVGIFSPNVDIAYAELASDRGAVDDLHFGDIPEPTTVFLLAAGLVGIWFVTRHRRRKQIGVIAIAAMLVLGTAGVGFAEQEITGQVTAWVVDGPEPICGDFGPLGCDQVALTSVPLADTSVCLEGGGSCVFTKADGSYDGLFYTGVDLVNVEAYLFGRFGAIGFVDESQGDPVFVPNPPVSVAEFDPNFPAPVHIALNPNHTPVLEGPTAEANLYYHFLVVRDFVAKHFPTYSGLTDRMGLEEGLGRQASPCSISVFFPTIPAMGAPGSEGEDCANFAFRDVIAQLYGSIMLHKLFEDEPPEPPFIDGFNAALALLLYDYPILMQEFFGPGSSLATFDFDQPFVSRRPFPCATDPEPKVNILQCREAIGGTWWDIKLNMQAKYNPPDANDPVPDCPVDPALNAIGAQHDYQLLIFDGIAISIGADLDGPPIKVPGDSSLTNTKGAAL